MPSLRTRHNMAIMELLSLLAALAVLLAWLRLPETNSHRGLLHTVHT